MSEIQQTALVRLEVRVEHLLAALDKQEKRADALEAKLDAVMAKLNESSGGVKVLRWFGFGSLASVLALGAMLYNLLHKSN
jgi:hypothetical protein